MGRRADDTARGLDPRTTPCEQGDAAGRVAAGFDFASVRVEDAHLHVRRLRRLDEDELVAADARLAVGNMAGPRAIHLQWRFARVEDDEIIAETMNFVKAARHRPRHVVGGCFKAHQPSAALTPAPYAHEG